MMTRGGGGLQRLLRRCAAAGGLETSPALRRLPGGACGLQQRGYADEPGEGEQSSAERAASGQEAGTSGQDEPAEEPPRRRGRRLSRKQMGSWLGNTGFTDEVAATAPVWPANQPLYDVQSQLPWLNEPLNPVFEGYRRLRQEQPEEFAKLLHSGGQQDAPPRPGAEKILEWEVNVVFESGPLSGEAHPLNKKVRCRVFLRDLQREFGLSDAALRHIALICGPRYCPRKGLLTLTSEKTHDREENRLHIVQMLHGLVAEGQAAFPAEAEAGPEAAAAG